MAGNDVKTQGIVLRRTNYEEADRIVNFLTPDGLRAALVKGARREKSKLAGGIEMFCLSDLTFHEKSKEGAGSLSILTSARPKKFYHNILSSLDRLELGSLILKKVARTAENFDSPELFNLTVECISALDMMDPYLICIETYFELNLAAIRGDTVNVLTDANGDKLDAQSRYNWDGFSQSLAPQDGGNLCSDHIKLLRLILASPLNTVLRVQNLTEIVPELAPIYRSFQ